MCDYHKNCGWGAAQKLSAYLPCQLMKASKKNRWVLSCNFTSYFAKLNRLRSAEQ